MHPIRQHSDWKSVSVHLLKDHFFSFGFYSLIMPRSAGPFHSRQAHKPPVCTPLWEWCLAKPRLLYATFPLCCDRNTQAKHLREGIIGLNLRVQWWRQRNHGLRPRRLLLTPTVRKQREVHAGPLLTFFNLCSRKSKPMKCNCLLSGWSFPPYLT